MSWNLGCKLAARGLIVELQSGCTRVTAPSSVHALHISAYTAVYNEVLGLQGPTRPGHALMMVIRHLWLGWDTRHGSS